MAIIMSAYLAPLGELDLDGENELWSNVHKLMESPHANFNLLPIAMFAHLSPCASYS